MIGALAAILLATALGPRANVSGRSRLPGHDPAVMTRFPKVADGLVRID